jgi:serine/threonine protein phosphatase PrpC
LLPFIMFKEPKPREYAERKEGFVSAEILSFIDFEHPRIFETTYGRVAAAIDAGLRQEKIEDRIVIAPAANSFAVIDGMGGMGRAAEAADALAERIGAVFEGTFQDRFRSSLGPRRQVPWKDLFYGVHESAYCEFLSKNYGGAVYLAMRLMNKELEYCMAGDVRLLFFKKNGHEIPISTEDEGSSAGVTNSISRNGKGTVTHWKLPLRMNWRFVLASDGLWKCLSNEEVMKLTVGKSAEDALRALHVRSLEVMKEQGESDHRSIIVGDIDRVM